MSYSGYARAYTISHTHTQTGTKGELRSYECEIEIRRILSLTMITRVDETHISQIDVSI